MRRKAIRSITAFALSVAMVLPQLSTGVAAMSVNTKVNAGMRSLEAGTTITKIDVSESWLTGQVEEIVFPEIEHYGDYENSITGISVNGVDYVQDWNDDDSTLVYTFNYAGTKITLGAIKEGDNTIVITSNKYQTKTIIVNKTDDTYTFVGQTDGDASDPDQTAEPTETAKPTTGSAVQPTEVPTQEPAVSDPTEDGEYTLTFHAYKADSSDDSMLGGFFADKAKLVVNDGKMTLSMLNVSGMNYMLDFAIESEGVYAAGQKANYGEADANGLYSAVEYTMEIKDLSVLHKAAALVTMMGGTEEDISNYDKYTKADLVFTSITKGWKGYVKSGDQALIDALIENKYDTDGDGEISAEELAAISGEVSLSNCGLTDISLLKGLSDKVTGLDLSENSIKTIPEGFFDNMTNLEYVYINSNYIETLPKDMFKNNKKLQWVNFCSNKLSKVSATDFSGLADMQYLELDNNAITEVENGALDGDTGLLQFSMVNNDVAELPADLLKDASKLEFINLSGNGLEVLPESLNGKTAMRRICAYNNSLTDISNIDYSKMPGLVEVNFMKNYIEQIPDGTFTANTKMLAVDFHDNQLVTVSGNAFPDAVDNGRDDQKLQKLDITMNNIKVVDPALMKKCDSSINKFYPQKTALSLTAKQDGNQTLSWSEELSALDLVWWYDSTTSDEKREIETVEDYKDMLEQNGWKDKDITEILSEKQYNWEVITQIQKKTADGTWVADSEVTNANEAEVMSGKVTVENGTYRVSKVVNTTLNGVLQYRYTAYSNEVVITDKQQTPVPTVRPTTPANNNKNNNNNSNNNNNNNSNNDTKNKVSNPSVKKITLKKVASLTIKKAKKAAKLKWKKIAKADGYQILRANSKKGKYKVVKTTKKLSYTDKKVKKGKTYYYKVRAYKKVNGSKVYGKASAVKKIKIKK